MDVYLLIAPASVDMSAYIADHFHHPFIIDPQAILDVVGEGRCQHRTFDFLLTKQVRLSKRSDAVVWTTYNDTPRQRALNMLPYRDLDHVTFHAVYFDDGRSELCPPKYREWFDSISTVNVAEDCGEWLSIRGKAIILPLASITSKLIVFTLEMSLLYF